MAVQEKVVPRLKEKYLREVVPEMMKEFSYQNVMEVPRVEKVVVNMGVGQAAQNIKLLDGAVRGLSLITGQKPVVRKAQKSIAGFKIRAGMPVGCKATLRGQRMYEFLDRLLSVALPRIRDFRGLSRNSFDGRGSYNLGVNEQLIFPEIDYDSVEAIQGMDITIVTTARTDEEAFSLLSKLGFPFRR
ncbi:large subunit ribosomal protein L5 [Candidatus Hakubella thermalkaliphila]|uniref:Large ribosomal subunit protein uL5 n=1 Tax=Candidatus Hakubella thermalkaliphila TaxID=2754717 RepID=A0A6V8PVZ5_9ACTN|nr:large subunit ribosomal protein L5 [Candidatus Hakubella thermalkaliphila]GFP34941.1 large subunit ribosomal protein L5 [Candidatus Hakubella thermalkaliphila]